MRRIGFSIGNGPSREMVDLELLRGRGVIFGSNALYRDFFPDALVVVDWGIVQELMSAGYQGRVIYPLEMKGHLPISDLLVPINEKTVSAIRIKDHWILVDSQDEKQYLRPLGPRKGLWWIEDPEHPIPVRVFANTAGPISCAMLANIEKCTDIFLVGHDLNYSNVYRGTDHYLAPPPTGWVHKCAMELRIVMERYPHVQFHRLIPDDSYLRDELAGLPNLQHFDLFDQYWEKFQ